MWELQKSLCKDVYLIQLRFAVTATFQAMMQTIKKKSRTVVLLSGYTQLQMALFDCLEIDTNIILKQIYQ